MLLIFTTLSFIPLNMYGTTNFILDDIQKKVTISMKDTTLEKILAEINRQTGVDYGFQSNGKVDKNRKFTIDVKEVSVEEALTILLKNSPYDFIFEKNRVVIIERKKVAKPVDLIKISGRIVDEKGNPIAGATIVIVGTTQGVASDAEGHYTIAAKPDDVLRVSFIGYKTETIDINGKEKLNARLNPTEENLEEVTVVAFGEQKRESIVSAITTIRPESLKSSNSDLTTTFAGKVPGMIAWQTGGLPGALTEEEMNTKFYIRGITSFGENAKIDPLILLDGVEVSKLDLARIDPEDIEAFSVLKDASATAMYGARGANGVILVTTKKGVEGNVYTSIRYEAIMAEATREIDVVDPVTYMIAYNEASMGRYPEQGPKYSADKINNTGNPHFPSWLYPANDWYNMIFRKRAINHHFGLNLRGGGSKVQYYASLNHNYDEGRFKSDRLNDFDVNVRNNQSSLRVNLNVNMTESAKLVVTSFTTLDQYKGPVSSAAGAYAMAFKASPVDYAAMYEPDETYNWPHLMFGGVTKDSPNPYMEMQYGYIERRRYSSVNRIEYIQNLSLLLKGLELRGNLSIYQEGLYVTPFVTEPYMYRLLDYDHQTGKHQLQSLKEDARSTLQTGESSSSGSTSLEGQFYLLHNGVWGDHTTSFTSVFNLSQKSNAHPGDILSAIPQRNMGLSMRLSYGYKNRYYLEGSFGYNGSERFDKDKRFGFFPAAGAAWIASKEPFMQSTSRWLDYLKLRLSYGQVGNDGIGGTRGNRFLFLPNIIQNKNTKEYTIRAYENPYIEWEIAEQVNLGAEIKLFKNLIELNIDAYQQVRHNILSFRTTIPATAGFGLNPEANIGKARSRGIDLEANVRHLFNPDFWFILSGTFTYSKATYLKLDEAFDKPVWQMKKGHDISQQIGYIAEGLFQSQEEIDAAPKQSGNVMPGDIRYRDISEDGVIDVYDATHIGFPTTPRIIYGFSGTLAYKDFEFNFSFQGSGQRSLFMSASALSPFVGDNALLKDIWEDHWSPDNMKVRPLWPRLSPDGIEAHNKEEYVAGQEATRYSTYFMREVKFLRCTALELGYNLPKRWLEKIKIQRLKVYARTNNPFIISNFDLWDVELGNSAFNYPIQRTYSVGVNLSF
ncbi:TonB-dependent receptor [Butyricimonas sp. Marseille-P3923]|uniref:TonB-dependent receptor n=1 Tax=Butyricimonas sp. Marseille-P3923 TaxID=1987504 RepID=UPI00210007E9|nr:TonB-dependent receptor [Butyricimonas sp. Marseille-P3923]